ncbi:MAG: ABC transporter permease, partial [Marinilabiliales bacterium]
MKKIGLIIAREYITRVRKRSFIIMTIIGPILIAALFIVPAWISQLEDTELKTIAVIDETFTFSDALNDSKYIKFINIENTNIEQEKKSFKETDYYALLYLPHNILNSRRIQIFSDKDVTLSVKMHISNQVTKEIERQKLRSENIDEDILKRIKTDLDVQTIKWTAEGEERESFTELKMVLGFAVGFMIYMFIFMYGSQVMRGVIEEKTNRIIEVIVSSVKPFQLMMGKIVGVAFVGLTQFILWVALSTTLVSVAKLALFEAPELGQQEIVVENILTQENANDLLPTGNEETEELADMLTTVIQSVDWTLMIFSFVIFFLGGYLLYSSMFAAVGSA